ncbi:hypothetical protein LRP50_13770 [Enterovibrio sp. ZSDZ42]|uniref:Uncharacterized protein n=1 Tax=Enterovibrio gelatinilyticus TaxID=2899819 RepID=A0ABT5R2F7_9GAMM|nr:hypothetical protein [Enterovibrio sp. ZSDZ42]MDD1794204.1 hypothetical protein [Enterovibrio sp. ZSDZ42]
MELFIFTFFAYFLYAVYQKRRSYRKIIGLVGRWQWWVEIVDQDCVPLLSGKIIKQNQSGLIFIVGCLHKSQLDSNVKLGISSMQSDLIPCRCIINPSEVILGEASQETIATIYEQIPFDKDECCEVILYSSDETHLVSESDISNFDEVWGDIKNKLVPMSSAEEKFNRYS